MTVLCHLGGFEPEPDQLGADLSSCLELQKFLELEKHFLLIVGDNSSLFLGQNNKLVLVHHKMVLKIQKN